MDGDVPESHGVLCALLCAPDKGAMQAWLADTFADLDAGADALAACREALGEMLAASARQLEGDEFAFAPLLPSDDEPLADRCAALGAWCSGFLYGLGIGGAGELESWSPQAREALVDLGELARLGEPDGDSDEADEGAYMELVEYVRVAVMLVYAQARETAQAAGDDDGGDRGS